MKKTLLTIALTALGIISANAQCTPDTSLNSTGIYFNEENVPCINEAYTEVVHMSIKNDTTVSFFGNQITVQMDSVIINTVTGLPEGLEYTCENPECKIVRNPSQTHTQTCIVISGTPTVLGDFDITFNVTIYAQGSPLNKDFVISSSVINCINGLNNKSSNSIELFPQPSNGNTSLAIDMHSTENVSIQLLNMNGLKLNNVFDGLLQTGQNKINISQYTSNLQKGIYLLNIQFENNTISKKLIIE